MLDSLLGIRSDSGWVNKSPMDDYWYTPRTAKTVSGSEINEDTAMAISTVFSCVAKVSKTIASLPISIVEKTGPNSRKPVDHPLAELLDVEANPESSGMTLREAWEANLELWGSAYVQIDWEGSGSRRVPGRLQVLESKRTSMKRDDLGQIYYEYQPEDGIKVEIEADRMWYTPGLSLDGLNGLSVVGLNREALGFSAALTDMGNAFFGNGAWAGGFITRPLDAPELSVEGAEAFIASVNEKFQGAKNAFGLGLLREGMEFKQLDIPFEDAMFLDSRKFQRVEICGMFDVNPIMIHDNENATYSNTEQADISFSKHSMGPRVCRFERSAKQRFLQGTKLSLKHNLAGMERGDYKSRHEGYSMGRQAGFYSINDIRAMEDMNPIEGGDTYLEPLNMWPVGEPRPEQSKPAVEEPEQQPPEENSEDNKEAAFKTISPMLKHAADRLAKRQCKGASTAWNKHARDGRDETFADWADKFFVAHAEIVRQELQPLLETWEHASDTRSPDTADHIAGVWCREWQESIADADTAITTINNWKIHLADEICDRMQDILLPENENDK